MNKQCPIKNQVCNLTECAWSNGKYCAVVAVASSLTDLSKLDGIRAELMEVSGDLKEVTCAIVSIQ